MTVHLVGTGPGDPDLLTVRAATLLEHAEVVVHDRLVDPRVLGLARRARLIDVGKRPGGSRSQSEINDLLVDLGAGGVEVVRAKGGDPFVFGRGGEEACALAAAGIPFTIVPGVTSAFAGAAAAGVPVTHRGVSAAVTVVAGHGESGAPAVDWQSLAKVGGTIVVLMGVARRQLIAQDLIAGGLSPSTPVAAVERATWADQSIRRVTLGALGRTHLENPAVLVIGSVAAIDVLAVRALATAGAA